MASNTLTQAMVFSCLRNLLFKRFTNVLVILMNRSEHVRLVFPAPNNHLFTCIRLIQNVCLLLPEFSCCEI